MNWFWPKADPKPFQFENGTVVYANDYATAITKLKKINEKSFSIQETGEYQWYIEFSPEVFINFESPSLHKARMQGPWLLIQDRRNYT
jgi:hypothetical protein